MIMKNRICRFIAFTAMIMMCLVLSENLFAETVAAAAYGVEYAYGEGYYYTGSDYKSIDIRIYWAEVKDAESYNIYLYSPKTKKYVNVKNVKDNDYGEWIAFISNYENDDLESYISGDYCYFKIGAVRNGKEMLSKQYSIKMRVETKAKRIAYRDDTVIYDFKLIDISNKGKSVNASTAKKAEKLVKNSEFYIKGMTHFYNQKAYNSECAKLIDKKGNIIPKAEKQFTYDYDNDGKNESFILVSLPLENGLARPYYIVVFRDSSGKMQIVDYCYSEGLKVELIDYGKFSHIHIGSYGGYGSQSWSSVYGIKNGKVKEYISDRMSLSNYNGLMRIDAHMGGGGMFYYDLRCNEYVGITGKPVTVNSVLALDTNNVIDEYVKDGIKSNKKCECYEWFGKYYIFIMDDRADMAYIYEYKNRSLLKSSDYSDWGIDSPRAFVGLGRIKHYVNSIDPEDIQACSA